MYLSKLTTHKLKVVVTLVCIHKKSMTILNGWSTGRGDNTHRAIHTGSITSPTKRSASANELSSTLAAVLIARDLCMTQRKAALPRMAGREAMPYNAARLTDEESDISRLQWFAIFEVDSKRHISTKLLFPTLTFNKDAWYVFGGSV